MLYEAAACLLSPARSLARSRARMRAEPLLQKVETDTGVACADFLNALWALPGGAARVLGGRCVRATAAAHRAHAIAHGA